MLLLLVVFCQLIFNSMVQAVLKCCSVFAQYYRKGGEKKVLPDKMQRMVCCFLESRDMVQYDMMGIVVIWCGALCKGMNT